MALVSCHPEGIDPSYSVRCVLQTGAREGKPCWVGQVIHCRGAARDPSIQNLFQSDDVDSGVIRWVNADLVTHILPAI